MLKKPVLLKMAINLIIVLIVVIMIIPFSSMSCNISNTKLKFVEKFEDNLNIYTRRYHYQEDDIDEIIEVSTDREEYGIGDIVTIITKNIGNEKIAISGPCFFIYNNENELIFDMCLFCYWELEPGDFKEIFWDQKNTTWHQVPPGVYTVKGVFRLGNELISDKYTFYICETNKFCGYVRSPDGKKPLEKATISIDAVDCIWITDEDGYWETGYYWKKGWWDLIASPPYDHHDIYMSSFQIAEVDKGETCWVNFTLEYKKENNPPENMIIEGKTKCKVNRAYDYIFSAEDPDKNQIYFHVYWGDGELPSLYKADSEGKIRTTRIWKENRDFTISAYPIDIYGYYGEGVNLEINVTKNKIKTNIIDFLNQNKFFNRIIDKIGKIV